LGSQSDLKEMGTASHLILEIVDDFFIQDWSIGICLELLWSWTVECPYF